MLGAIIGDIVGSRFERNSHKSKDFELFTDQCRFTDDTAMTVAIAKALLECNGDYTDLSNHAIRCMQEIGQKYPDAGYGRIFYQWLYKKVPGPYWSYGNGSAMRVSPVAYVAKSAKECIKLSDAVTRVSHNHPEGMKGAEAIASMIFGTEDKVRRKFVDDCKLEFAEKIPVCYNFDFTSPVLGHADVSRDEDGLLCKLTLSDINAFSDDEYFVGGYYDRVKRHIENGVTIIDSARLVSVSIVPEHGVADENLKVRRVETNA